MLKGFRQFLLRGNVIDLAVRGGHRRRLRGVVTALVRI
jgi:large-conductance mechanosensitive channel